MYAEINEALEDILGALDEQELVEFEPITTAAAVAAGAYALKKAKDISHAERARKKGVSPNEYYDLHGKCPPGYNKADSYGGTKCVPTGSKVKKKILKVLNKKIF